MDPRAIGVFDSGVGGLTVARSLIDLLPTESIVYFGDNKRGPWGPRPQEEVRAFAAEIADALVADGVKMVVVACNSASSAGVDHIRTAHPEVPVIEVWEPTVRAAVSATRNRRVGVIGTELTIESKMYERAVEQTRADVDLFSAACPRFVEFVERGETSGEDIMALAQQYLQPLKDARIDTLMLGCTHYPLLRGVIQYVMGREVVLIESDREVAIDVFAELTRRDMFSPRDRAPSHRFASSGDPHVFAVLGQQFLGPEISDVEELSWS